MKLLAVEGIIIPRMLTESEILGRRERGGNEKQLGSIKEGYVKKGVKKSALNGALPFCDPRLGHKL